MDDKALIQFLRWYRGKSIGLNQWSNKEVIEHYSKFKKTPPKGEQ